MGCCHELPQRRPAPASAGQRRDLGAVRLVACCAVLAVFAGVLQEVQGQDPEGRCTYRGRHAAPVVPCALSLISPLLLNCAHARRQVRVGVQSEHPDWGVTVKWVHPECQGMPRTVCS